VAKQIPLDLPVVTAMTRDDFLVTEANRAAMALIDQWPNWPSHGAILCGPAGSGKSHLAAIWQNMADAKSIAADTLTRETVPDVLAKGSAVIENIETPELDEAALFHLLNLVRQNRGHVLLTTSTPPQELAIKLPDLRSRISSLPIVNIAAPDDALLRGVLVKLFADRQIAVDEALISYLLTRMPRSLGTARELVARIDEEALAQGAEVTRTFAGKILAEINNPDVP
jgi:chromosomal replication initiation ATPase DnaA